MATETLLNAGADFIAKLFLHKISAPTDLVLHLYVNNHTPAVTDTTAAYTECSALGYASVGLTNANWTGTVAGGVADYTYPAITFTFTSGLGQTVYGIYITDAPGDVVLAGLLDTAFPIPIGGGSLVVNLEHKQRQC